MHVAGLVAKDVSIGLQGANNVELREAEKEINGR